MWHDKRATIDLIGFERYADAIAGLLLNDRLLPLTVGIYGEWGSGKSSVMYLTEQRLMQGKDEEDAVLCISFNGWMLQGYDDTKAALMTKIIETLKEKRSMVSRTAEKAEQLLKKVNWFRLTAMTLKQVVVPIATSYVTGALPGIVMPSVDDIASIGSKTDVAGSSATQTIEEFKKDFEALLKEAKVRTLVVFVDDLDRCLPSVVVDILEAIKLFLSVERTAFVIGADESTINQAIAVCYPHEKDIETISKIYLEKIIQIPVHLHPLSESETETYLNLLFAELHQEPEDCRRLAKVAAENRARAPLKTALDYEVIRSALEDKLKPGYVSDLGLAAKIAPVICQHERGNPRQIKRFLNTLLLRQRIASAYGLTLDAQILSKLMILEYYHTEPHFKQLFEWQMAGDGIASELATLEQMAQQAIEEAPDEDASDEEIQIRLSSDITKTWLENKDVKSWLQMEPALGNENLEKYFFIARERLARYGFRGSDLSRNVREILLLLLSDDGIEREQGKARALKLTNTEIEGLFSTAAGRIPQIPDSSDFVAVLCDIAAQRSLLIPVLVKGLERVPDTGLPTSVPNRLGILAEEFPDYKALITSFLNKLKDSPNGRLATVARQVLDRIMDGD